MGPESSSGTGATLDAWTKDPFSLADRLDTACKMKIIDHELRRAGIGWNDLNDGLKVLGGLRQRYPARLMRAVLTDDSKRLSAEESAKFAAARATVRMQHRDRSELLRFVARLRPSTSTTTSWAACTTRSKWRVASGAWSSIGPTSIGPSTSPPPGGRAAYRGGFIRQHQGQGWACDWMSLVHRATGQVVHLSDPFADGPTSTTSARPQPADPSSTGPGMLGSMEEAMSRLDPVLDPTDRERITSLLSRAFGRR